MDTLRSGLEWLGTRSDRATLRVAAWSALAAAAVAGCNVYLELSEAHVLDGTRQQVAATADPQFAGYLDGEIATLHDSAGVNAIIGVLALAGATASFAVSRAPR